LAGGEIVENEDGTYFSIDYVYPITQKHGHWQLGQLLEKEPLHLGLYGSDALAFRDCLFIDTETTGLHGAGTLAFMVGVGFYDGDVFVVRQYFVRDFEEEAAMLADLARLVAVRPNLVTFNGKTFDIPLLQTRYLMNRQPDPFDEMPHLDLLTVARKLWRRRLGSVRLGALEEALLGVPRTQEDVAGYLIPTLYHDYLRSADPRPLKGIFYHNRVDILSMVSLSAEILHLLTAPDHCQHALDVYSLAKWQVDLQLPLAEAYLRQAASMASELETWQLILLELGGYLKRIDRRVDAVPLWLQVAHTSADDVTAHIELAKYYEWHQPDLTQALAWTEAAFALIDPFDRTLHEALTHRKQRLLRKLTTQ
jgi:uncharacterized protein YprB with RNaseH-like and TPR domain